MILKKHWRDNLSKDTQIHTFTGQFFDFEDLDNNQFHILDIAHALANQCRWTGHTKFFYSVCEHSVLCHDIAVNYYGPDIQYEALMHDASEAYMMDLSRPLKRMFKDYTDYQLKLETKIAE